MGTPAAEQRVQFLVQVAQGADCLLAFTGFPANRRLQ
jgi:hypothetical protein